jgi:4-alpha-glucanotransferase
VLYTGTHDNDTLRGWYESLPARAARVLRDGRRRRPRRRGGTSIGVAQRSPARLCMLQVQDVLGLGNEARMNLPGTATGNWRFQLEPGQLTKRHARRLRALSRTAGRDVAGRPGARGERPW